MDQEITVRQGEHVEIRLPAKSWSVTLRDATNVLQPVEPQGEPEGRQQELVWRYLALRPGSAVIVCTGRAVHKPGTKTPHFVLARTYTVNVTA